MRVSIKKVPLEVRRIAGQHLESLRGSEALSGAESARLADQAVPVYRPDIDGVAYWEFSVVGAAGGKQSLKSSRFAEDKKRGAGRGDEPIGFIVASNGRHDFPISHWSLDRLPPSLQVVAEGSPIEGFEEGAKSKPKRLYRVDSLCYAAEDADGNLVGQTGPIPPLLQGLPHDLSRVAGQISSSIGRLLKPAESDDSVVEQDTKRSGAKRTKVKQAEEGSWDAMKEGYVDSFGPLLDHLRKRAARTWDIEDAIREFGEGIVAGETLRVALLGDARVELTGDGMKHVRAVIEDSDPPVLVLTAAEVSLPHEMSFDAIITYQDGEGERLPFFVVSRDVPSNTKAKQDPNLLTDHEE